MAARDDRDDRRTSDTLLEMSKVLGRLEGSMQIGMQNVQNELSRLNSELIRLQGEVDTRHVENINQIARHHDSNITEIKAVVASLDNHEKNDDTRFGGVNGKIESLVSWRLKVVTVLSVVSTIIGVIWAVVTFLAPHFMKG